MPKPSWCLVVMTMYFMPASLAMRTHSFGVELHGIELLGEFLVLGDGHFGLLQEPFGVVVLLPFHSPAGTE